MNYLKLKRWMLAGDNTMRKVDIFRFNFHRVNIKRNRLYYDWKEKPRKAKVLEYKTRWVD